MERVPNQHFADPGERGFTLVELMVTVAIAVILAALAVPSFNRLMISNKLTTAANEVVISLNLAKMQGIKRNAPTQFCSSSAANNTADTLGAACGTQGTAVYVQTAGGSLSTSAAATAQIRDVAAGIGQTSIQVSSAGITAIRFGGQGLGYQAGTTTPYTGTVVDICSTVISTDNHRVVALTTGTIITTSTSTGACP